MKLNENFNQQEFIDWIGDFLPDFSKDIRKVDVSKSFQGIKSIQTIGESALGVRVYIIETEQDPSKRKIGLATESFTLLRNYGTPNAIIVYYSENSSLWRLSLLTSTLTWDEGKIKKKLSNPKRQSYVLGTKAKVKTPHQYLVGKGTIADFNDLKSRFSLEVVNKEFYKEISQAFIQLVGGHILNGKSKKTVEAQLKLPFVKDQSQTSQEFAVRLIGRIIFCWFLREKRSASGHSLMPKELLSSDASSTIEDYYHKILEPIFFEVLNKPIKTRKETFINDLFSAIPYLNGGLFSPHEDDFFNYNEGKQAINHNIVVVPDSWLKSLFEVLETYNFTIDENTSFDEELSIDPEMLGRIFENLLAEINPETGESARKSTGSYYTPRVIVDYMVDESLHLYLHEKTNISENKLRSLISYDLEDDNINPLKDEEKDSIAQALGAIKILDPACGSGAFPIGALQKIVFILQQIDQNGQLWFKKQIQNTPIELRKVIEREFQEKNFDYIRKLGIIRENIYGIDIQPIATEISRLRCFLTLVVDERIDDTLENRGIEPLPNLDFKFVTANTLVGLPTTSGSTSQMGLFEDDAGIKELKEVRDMFFNASGFERDQLKLQFVQTQNRMFQKLISEGLRGHADMTAKLTTWDPFSHKSADWFDQEWMFGIKDGFDLVIANPPYISHDKIQDKDYFKKNYKVFEAFADLYCFFIENALRVKNETGITCFITSNSYLRADYGKPLRKYLLNHTNIKSIINIDDFQVFGSAIVNTAILFTKGIRNSKLDTKSLIVNKSFTKTDDFIKFVSSNSFQYTNNDFDENSWTLTTPERLKVQRLIKAAGQTLESYKTKIRLGLATGNNDVFLINETQRDIFISEDPKNLEIIKPILRGKDIYRYGYEHNGLYIILAKNGINIKDDYPVIYKYFESFGDKFKKRGAQGQNWWNLRACAFFDDFKSEKIIWIELNDDGRFALASDEIYLVNSAYFLLPPEKFLSKYLLGILNSRVIRFYLSTIAETSGMGVYRWINNYVKEFPIPEISLKEQQIIVNLVDQILDVSTNSKIASNSDKNRHLEELQKKLDLLIYDIYHLSKNDIAIINDAVK